MNTTFSSDGEESFISTLLASPDNSSMHQHVSRFNSSVNHSSQKLSSPAVSQDQQQPAAGLFAMQEAAKLRIVQQQGEILELRHSLSAKSHLSERQAGAGSVGASRKRPRGAAAPGAVQLESTKHLEREIDLESVTAKYEKQLSDLQASLDQATARASTAEGRFREVSAEAAACKRRVLELQQPAKSVELPDANVEKRLKSPKPFRTDPALVLESRLREQAASHEQVVQELQRELEAQVARRKAAEAAALDTHATNSNLGAHAESSSELADLQSRAHTAESAAAGLRKELAAAERRFRRLQSTLQAPAEREETMHTLKAERDSLQESVARLRPAVQAEAKASAALQRGLRAAADATQRLKEISQLNQQNDAATASAASPAASPDAESAAEVWATLGRAVAEAVQACSTLATTGHENAQALGTLRAKLVRAERQAIEDCARASALEGELAQSDASRIQAQTAAASAERRVATLTRELQAMESALSEYSSSPKRRNTAGGAAGLVTPVKGDASGTAVEGHLADALKVARQEIAELRAAANSSMTPNAAVSKLQAQLSAAQSQLAQCNKQLQGALAKQEQLMAENAALHHQVGRGDFNSSSTKVLHLRSNPLRDATAGAQAQLQQQVAEMQDEVGRLRTALAAAQAANQGAAPKSVSVPSLNESTAFVPAAQLEQAKKKTERLMSVFKERMKTFKDGLYEITGWKVNIDQRAGEANAIFRLSSQFAEREADELKFEFQPGGEVRMLKTEFCPDRVDPKILLLLQMGSNGRLPAFLASLTLDLHGKQTMV